MSTLTPHLMYLFVFFDLPVKTKEERRAAALFRKFLLDDGYLMIQYSVYARICNGQERLDKHLARVQQQSPRRGCIRAMQVTELQYCRMKFLAGKQPPKEKIGTAQLILLSISSAFFILHQAITAVVS
jgi:CRISPR-associated protein Cas2